MAGQGRAGTVTTRARAAYARTAVADESAVLRATALVIVVLCLLTVSEAAYGATSGGLGEVPVVAALAVLPLLYMVPAARQPWLRHRYPLLGLQAALTYMPFALFGAHWALGPSGWLAGLVLLTVPSPASWFMSAALAAAEEAVRAGVVGFPYQPATSSAPWSMAAFVFDALILFGLARLTDLIMAVHAARNELTETAVTAERVRAADSLRAAIGDRLAEAADQSAAALRTIAANASQAREHTAKAAATARQALAEVREMTAKYRYAPWPEATPAEDDQPLAPRLAQTVLVVMLCGVAVLDVVFVGSGDGAPYGYGPPVVAWTVADAIALVVLQLRHSWPSRGVIRPRGWPATLILQAFLTYVLFPVTGWHPLVMCGFLAGSGLLLMPDWAGGAVFAAVLGSVPVLWTVKPSAGVTALHWLGAAVYLTMYGAVLGLLVYGLTWLAQLAVQLGDLRGELARQAVAGERLRVARDTHDLLGLGLSAIAMKADLIGKLIGRDDARADAEIAELARICATARADIRLVAGEARDLPLGAELAAAHDVLASAGIDVRARVNADPSSEAAAVLVPVVREAVTNILKHSSASYCVLEMTATAGRLQLLISNDGSDDANGAPLAATGPTGNGLRNLAARLAAAGGHLVTRREDDIFSLTAELPAG